MNKKIIIFGCGISGATLANELASNGWNVIIYEKQGFVGGNCFDETNKDGILIHKYGPHIFHTSYDDVFKFISKFTKLNNFVNKVLVNVDNKLFPLPINFKSIEIIDKQNAKFIINKLKASFPNRKTITLFDLKQLNDDKIRKFYDYILNNVYVNYSAKMWGKKFEEINPSTINRVKIVLDYEHNYFPDDKYQGLPIDGYTKMIERMVQHKNIKVELNTTVIKPLEIIKTGQTVVYCGSVDDLLNNKFGILPYRSLNIKFETLKKDKFQDTAVINYPADPKMTRIAEYKQMTLQVVNGLTTISKEYPGQFDIKSKVFNTKYYPIINPKNLELYNKYVSELKKYKNLYLLGRLAQYKYFDMDDAIKEALELAKKLNHE